ncbi:MAG: aspartate--tRNA(Asn) ligase, partial [Clostridia bacterium]|nr:aspartate--tRNA(Asn) ligase [Clostridia bacterium]
MERVYAADAKAYIGREIKVQGFIENLRNGAAMAFIVLKDISGKLQITVEKEKLPALVPVIDSLTPDSVVTVTGVVIENEYVKMGGIEVIPSSIVAESIADALPIVRKDIPATKKKQAVERSSID